MPEHGDMDILVGLLKEMRAEVSGRFDKLEAKYDAINNRFQHYALKADLQSSNEAILDSFSKVTDKMEEVIISNATSSQKFIDFERRLVFLEAGNTKKSDSRTILMNSLIAGTIASLVSVIGGLIIRHL